MYSMSAVYPALILPTVRYVFVLFDTLCPSQQFCSHVGMISWVKKVLSNENMVPCSSTHHAWMRFESRPVG